MGMSRRRRARVLLFRVRYVARECHNVRKRWWPRPRSCIKSRFGAAPPARYFWFDWELTCHSAPSGRTPTTPAKLLEAGSISVTGPSGTVSLQDLLGIYSAQLDNSAMSSSSVYTF